MNDGKKTVIINSLCCALVLLSGIIRLVGFEAQLFSYNCMIFSLFSFALMIWIYRLHNRLVQTDVRRNLIAAASLMIFWMATRTLKYDFLPTDHFTSRYAWYMYYIPMLYIPLFMFLSVLAIGRPHLKPVSGKWYLLFIPTTLIVLGVLTNDLHGMAFCFTDGLVNWKDDDFTRGFVYYAAVIWMVLLFLATLAVAFIRCAVPSRRRMIWVPMVPLVFGAVFTLLILFEKNTFIFKMLTAPEIGCFVYAAFMESLISVHLFPTNNNYGDFWNASSFGAGIMDNNGIIRYESETSIPVTLKQVYSAQYNDILLQNGEVSLRSHAIQGGYGYWLRDISEINRLNAELEELGNVTAQENSMLAAENRMNAERIHIEEQNKLYDDMARGVKPQLAKLDALLEKPPEDEAEFERTMSYACILNAYVKRHSDLLLLYHQNKKIHSEELRRAVAESLEYCNLSGIKTQCTFDGRQSLNGQSVMLIHELFEAVLESAIPDVQDILVYFRITEACVTMQMELQKPREIIQSGFMSEKLFCTNSTLEIETEDDTEYVTFTLSYGGEGA